MSRATLDRHFPDGPDSQASGLEFVDSIDDADSYQFHTLAAWRDKSSGRVYYASDSGCSCPTPFEDHTSLSSFTELTEESLPAFDAELGNWENPHHEREKFRQTVLQALRGAA